MFLPPSRAAHLRSSLRLASCALFVLVAGAVTYGAAAIEGRVTLRTPRSAPVANKRYEIVSAGGILATNPPLAVVSLAGDFPAPAAGTVRTAVTQKDMAFVPALLAIEAGTTVEFPNHDDTYHNIFSYSQPKRFDLGRYRPDERPIPAVVFDQPGLVVLRCDIHEHMRGLILIVASPHFTLTNSSGEYRLNDLPVGKFTVKVWLDSQTTIERAVELSEGQTLHLDFP